MNEIDYHSVAFALYYTIFHKSLNNFVAAK